MKPRIGIMSRYLAKDNRFVTKAGYIYAISAVGGLPIQIPIADIADVDAIAGMVDGIIITGGADVTPLVYGEQPVPAIGPTCGANDRFEIFLSMLRLKKSLRSAYVPRHTGYKTLPSAARFIRISPARYPAISAIIRAPPEPSARTA